MIRITCVCVSLVVAFAPAASAGEPGGAEGRGLLNSVGMKFAWIPAGKFMMGSPDHKTSRYKDEPLHEVHLTRGFYMGVHEVTQGEFERVMGRNPSYFSATGGGKDKVKGMETGRFPVEQVSWQDAEEFCRKLSELPEEKKAKRSYRLPTEAEWEYACRGGRKDEPFHFGRSLSSLQANFNGNFPHGAEKGPFLERTTAVGSYQPNPFGLFDMHGNVAEMCSDWYGKDYYLKSPVEDPQGPAHGEGRVVRGGGWDSGLGQMWSCLSAERGYGRPTCTGSFVGFRVVLVQP